MMIVFDLEGFDPPEPYFDQWEEWIDNATGSQRCISASWRIEEIYPKEKEIAISYEGEDAHDGRRCRGVIYSNFDGKVREVEPWG